VAFLQLGDFATAERYMIESLDQDKLDPEVRYCKARIHEFRGEDILAIDEYDQCVALSEMQHWRSMWALAALCIKQGQIPEAQEFVEAVLQVNPGFLPAATALEKLQELNKCKVDEVRLEEEERREREMLEKREEALQRAQDDAAGAKAAREVSFVRTKRSDEKKED
jgi:tetratricopeptide (TPR) repeat protein